MARVGANWGALAIKQAITAAAATVVAVVLLAACGGSPLTVEDYAAFACRPPANGGAGILYVDESWEGVRPPSQLESFHDHMVESGQRRARADDMDWGEGVGYGYGLHTRTYAQYLWERLSSLPLGAAAALAEACAFNWLIVVSDGSRDALLLEWAGGPPNATGWQYRIRMWEDGPGAYTSWSPWQDVPGSDGATRRYRLTGLATGSAPEVEVRAVTGDVPGPVSNPAEGVTAGLFPEVSLWIVEGDGETRWNVQGFSSVVVIPDGMRLRKARGWVNGGWCSGGSGLIEMDTLSVLSVCIVPTRCELGRYVQSGGAHDVEAFFDQFPLAPCPERPEWEDATGGGETLGLAAVGTAAIAAYAVAVWWLLRRRPQVRG